ncbi:MAG: valine--tRNA ligase [Firmicutes bacterium]|nr:valine--tRNA ligase [Bacillota bacterium]
MSETMEAKQLSTTYQPLEVEGKRYEQWLEKGYFSCDIHPQGEPFCIVMPPPNVTGQLHMGHALDNTLQDVLSRWRRMQGRRVLWLPGTDHAGIATQAKIEEQLAKEGLNKYELGREAFLERAWQWKEKYHARIVKQLRMMGASCDWDKERFTMDEGCSKAVRRAFVNMYKKGLIYRGSYIVNWCCHCQTTISDIEVEHAEREGHLWYLRYPYADGSGYVVVATTRPETLLGDTAVAVHPADPRYQDKIGKTVILPVMDREIPIIGDEYCDMEFGTGAVKITPAHDPNDFEIGLRHHLEQITVLGKDGRMNENAGKYAGMTALECREKLIEEFREMGLLEKITDLTHGVGQCYRCGSVVEPLVSTQWFVKMPPLAKPALEAVTQGDTKFVPERFSRVYGNWLENIRDWCISRQLWWGHRIPVWYCADCGEEICAEEDPDRCPKCGGVHLEQDPDVLDTWFSSGLWPFSTLGWPEQTQLLKDFYPTSVLVTGYDIIFFWVARMMFSGMEHMGEKPFSHVFIHGIVRDEQGRKMSKSLGNGVDPIQVIEQYGADSLRFMLMTGNSPGNDMRFKPERLEASRNFLNKLWNASRFTLMNLAGYQPGAYNEELTLADQWILERLRRTALTVNDCLENFELGEALRKIYDFVWDEYCDWYVELAKLRLYKGSEVEKYTAQKVLSTVLSRILELLHPFIPFITEEIWQQLPHQGETVMLAAYPDGKDMAAYPREAEQMNLVMDIVRCIRNLRAEMNVPMGKKARVILQGEASLLAQVKPAESYILSLAAADSIIWAEPAAAQEEQAAKGHVRGVDIYLPLAGLIDLNKEIARLQKEIDSCQKDMQRLSAKLSNASFLAKAPEAVVEKEKQKEKEAQEKLASLQAHLALLQ